LPLTWICDSYTLPNIMNDGMPRRYCNLRDYLKGTGTTQRELAERVGVTQSAISMAANGHSLSLGLAKRISAATGVPVESFGESEQRPCA
jgi:transcriptional regulator with XRE-family HTH domain